MSEPINRLRELLARLQSELQSAADLDPAQRLELQQALQEAAGRLDSAGNQDASSSHAQEAPESSSWYLQMKNAVTEFEESHPTLVQALSQFIDTLTQLGI